MAIVKQHVSGLVGSAQLGLFRRRRCSLHANTSSKATTIAYWIVTALFCLRMTFTAYAHETKPMPHSPRSS